MPSFICLLLQAPAKRLIAFPPDPILRLSPSIDAVEGASIGRPHSTDDGDDSTLCIRHDPMDPITNHRSGLQPLLGGDE